MKSEHNLTSADYELLLYLNPLRFFVRQDFEDGTLLCNWERKRFERLLREGWIKCTYKGIRRHGERNKYVVSPTGKKMIRKVYRILVGLDDIPMTIRREAKLKGKSYMDRLLVKSINRKHGKKRIE